jgi:signal transduction histidine kinase
MSYSAETRPHPPHNNGPHNANARVASKLRAFLATFFRGPFRVDPEAVFTYTPAERERRRRSGIFRLVVACLTVIEVVWLPLVYTNHAPVHVIEPQILAVILGILCLILNHRGYTTLAGALYIYGLITLAATAAIIGYPLVTTRTLLLLCLLSALIWLSTLVLPVWAIWPTAALCAAIGLCTILFVPLSPALARAGAPGEEPHGVIIGLLTTIYVLSATLCWVSARSAGAGMASTLRAFEREREMITLKDQFILTANHELRTPLAALYSNVELLAVLGNEASPEERERIVDRALRAGDALLTLLNTVLDASSVEEQAAHLTIQPVHLPALVRDLLQTTNLAALEALGSGVEEASDRPLRVDIPANIYVLADELRLRQVLLNLLSNALKYSDPGTPIDITVRRLRQNGAQALWSGLAGEPSARQIRVSVRDFGLGVPPSQAPNLFQRFVRLERDTGGTVRGTGVGLYLSRMFIVAMGGRIWVESSGVPGEGSEFSFTLPSAPLPGGALPESSSTRSG